MKISFLHVLWVGVGGSLGAVSRYMLSNWVQSFLKTSLFPIGIFVTNAVGCLILGLLMGWFEAKNWGYPHLRNFLFVGFLGGFTTFSTFAYDSFLLGKSEMSLAVFNIAGQVILGLLCVWGGYVFTKQF